MKRKSNSFNDERISRDDAALAWASRGMDEDYTFGYEEDELKEEFFGSSDYHSEEEYFASKKQDDHYHFSFPFDYIKKNYGDDRECDWATTNMEVDVTWNTSKHSYEVRYYAPEMYLIDPAEGNGDVDSFFSSQVDYQLTETLESLDIYSITEIF